LPLGPTGYGDSPYQCFSAFAGNTNLISPEKTIEDVFNRKRNKNKKKFPVGKVDYGAVYDYKNGLLKKAFARFRETTDPKVIDSFHRFCDENAFWLEDYALFRAAKMRAIIVVAGI
jgi:4-alpha-glucanotransferase